MRPRPVSAIAMISIALLAGCASPAPTAAVPTATSVASAPQTAAPALALWLAGPGTLAPTPPVAESSVTLNTPANGPLTRGDAYPKWTATLAQAADVDDLTVHLFVQTSSASAAANTVPFAGDLPGVGLSFDAGAVSLEGATDAPDVLRAGETYELVIRVAAENETILPAGTEVTLRAYPYYTHVAGAAEFRFLMGPQHPARLLVGEK